MATIAMTGHRPERLGLPTDVREKEWKQILGWIFDSLAFYSYYHGHITVFTGMASGADMAMGYVAASMKRNGYPIQLHCICPFEGYGAKDPVYDFVMKNADKVVNIHDKWVKGCDNDRDEYMAKNCDQMLAIFDGHKCGGVWSTIKKAEKYNVAIGYCPTSYWPDAYKEEV